MWKYPLDMSKSRQNTHIHRKAAHSSASVPKALVEDNDQFITLRRIKTNMKPYDCSIVSLTRWNSDKLQRITRVGAANGLTTGHWRRYGRAQHYVTVQRSTSLAESSNDYATLVTAPPPRRLRPTSGDKPYNVEIPF
jgi:hypothetical protein